jgi:hypothetical protein
MKTKTVLSFLSPLFLCIGVLKAEWQVSSRTTILAHRTESSQSTRQGSHFNACFGDIQDRSSSPYAYQPFGQEINVRYLIASGYRGANDYGFVVGAMRGLWDGKFTTDSRFSNEQGNELTFPIIIANNDVVFKLTRVVLVVLSSDPSGFHAKDTDIRHPSVKSGGQPK